jgi:hypothetical protein
VQYILTGFSHEKGYRVFVFESVDGRVRTAYRVKADLALARKHGVPVQELPLLCRALLETRTEGESQRAYTYGEAEMRKYEDLCAARAAELQNKKRPLPRRPPVQKPGQTWRVPQV